MSWKSANVKARAAPPLGMFAVSSLTPWITEVGTGHGKLRSGAEGDKQPEAVWSKMSVIILNGYCALSPAA